jgi:hypothetical protein
VVTSCKCSINPISSANPCLVTQSLRRMSVFVASPAGDARRRGDAGEWAAGAQFVCGQCTEEPPPPAFISAEALGVPKGMEAAERGGTCLAMRRRADAAERKASKTKEGATRTCSVMRLFPTYNWND